jgi:hypothetical protein
VPGGESLPRVKLFLRRVAGGKWRSFPMELAGRRTFVKEIKAGKADSPLLEYYVEASFSGPSGNHRLTAPVGAPGIRYIVTVLD